MGTYQLSKKKPAAVVGKALPLRVKMPGRKIKARTDPVLGAKPKGVLPAKMKAGKLRVRLS